MQYQISAFYGATAFRVGESASQRPSTLANRTPVEFVSFSAGILPGQTSGDRCVVSTADGQQYSVLSSQVVDAK